MTNRHDSTSEGDVYYQALNELLEDEEHDPDGKYMGILSDGDMFRHDDITVVFAWLYMMYDGRDFLTGDANVAVTIGPADAIEKPEVENDW